MGLPPLPFLSNIARPMPALHWHQLLPTFLTTATSSLLAAAFFSYLCSLHLQAWWVVNEIPLATYLVSLSFISGFLSPSTCACPSPSPKTSEILFSYSPFYFLLNLKQSPLSITSHHLRPSVWLSLLLLLSPEVMKQVPEKRWDDCYQILVVSILRC